MDDNTRDLYEQQNNHDMDAFEKVNKASETLKKIENSTSSIMSGWDSNRTTNASIAGHASLDEKGKIKVEDAFEGSMNAADPLKSMGEGIGESVNDALATTTYRESEAYSGKQEINKHLGLIGVDISMGGISGGDTLSAYSSLRKSMEEHGPINIGGKAFTGNGDSLADYRAANSELDKFLVSKKINASELSERQIKKALEKGKLGKVSIQGNAEIENALKEKLFLKGLEKDAQKAGMKPNKTFVGTIGNTWKEQALGDSDFEAGYKAAKGMTNAAVVTGKLGGATVGGVLHGSVSVLDIGDKIRVFAKGKMLDHKIKITDPSDLAKLKTLKDSKIKLLNDRANFRGKIANVHEGITAAVHPGRTSKVFIGKGASRVGNFLTTRTPLRRFNPAIKFFREKVHPVRWIKNKWATSLMGRFFGALNALKRWIQKQLLKLGLVVLAIILFDAIFLMLFVAPGSPVMSDSDSDTYADGSVQNSNMQTAINEFFGIQKGFVNNIYNYSPGSIFADKMVFNDAYKTEIDAGDVQSLFQPWELERYLSEETEFNHTNYSTIDGLFTGNIQRSDVKFFSADGQLAGYNLYNYYGAKKFLYSTTIELVDAAGQGTGVFENFNYYGEAGINGDVGDLYPTDDPIDLETTAWGPGVYANRASTYGTDESRVQAGIFYFGPKRSNYTYDYSYVEERIHYHDSPDTVNGYKYYDFGSIDTGALVESSGDIRGGEFNEYTIDSMYKAVLSMGYAITNNQPDINYDEYNNYIRRLFLSIMGRTNFMVETQYYVDYTHTLKYVAVTSDGARHDVEFPAIRPIVKLSINHRESGVYSVAYISNTMNNLNLNLIYPNSDTISDGWFMEGGVGYKVPTEELTNALCLWEMDNDCWKDLYEDLILPSDMLIMPMSQVQINAFINDLLLNNMNIPVGLEEMYRLALSLIGTPYVFGGNDPLSGFDCSHFISYIANQAGLWSGYYSTVGLLPYAQSTGGHIDFSTLAPGTVIIKNSVQSGSYDPFTETIQYNHMSLFMGNDESGRPIIIEAVGRPTNQVSLATDSRINAISHYAYVVPPGSYPP